MNMNGSKSATTTSTRRHHFNPGSDFTYKIVTRTFSREGMRPATSPARIKSMQQIKKNLSLSPEDVIAAAQSPNIQNNFGETLMMLSRTLPKVRPGKFLELKKIMNQPSTLPSPRLEASTPRLVKAMITRAKTAGSWQSGSMSRTNQSRYIHQTRSSKSSSSASRSQRLALQSSDTSEEAREGQSSMSYSKSENSSERCVRCAEFPDIQIEGKSLSRILTNKNVLMSKEHCEVLGAHSCPDCVRVRSQRHHDYYCNKNTPAIANDVYKIALIQERSPNMTKQEVQRKFFDGEISDKLFNVSHWSQEESVVAVNQGHLHEQIMKTLDEKEIFLPLINDAGATCSTLKKPTKASANHSASEFETIFEMSENGSEFGYQEEKPVKDSIVGSDGNETKELIYERHKAEEPMAVQVVPASETSQGGTSLETRLDSMESFNGPISQTGSAKFSTNKIPDSKPLKVSKGPPDKSFSKRKRKVIKVEAGNQTESNFIQTSMNTEKRKSQRRFTVNVIPSKNFFFDISDLAERMRNSGVVKTQRSQSRIQHNFLFSNSTNPNRSNSALASAEEKLEKDSASSNDSLHPLKDFNMSYEPPFFFDYKGGHLGVGSTISRRSSVVSRA